MISRGGFLRRLLAAPLAVVAVKKLPVAQPTAAPIQVNGWMTTSTGSSSSVLWVLRADGQWTRYDVDGTANTYTA